MKIAIIGGTGLLGSNLVKYFSSFDVQAFSRSSSSNIDKSKNNIINFNNINTELNSYFNDWKPDIIINAVGLVNLQECQDNYPSAYFSNYTIPEELAKVSKEINSYFIHISTDHYYNDSNLKHNEENNTIVLNNYAKIKLAIEKEILNIYSNSLIVRTNIIGFRLNHKDSFFEWLIKSLEKEEIISLYENYLTSPISVNQLSNILLLAKNNSLTGIYNIASSEVISKYDFGLKAACKFGYNVEKIQKLNIINNAKELSRALTLGLDISKIENKLNVNMPTIDEVLDSLYKEYKKLDE